MKKSLSTIASAVGGLAVGAIAYNAARTLNRPVLTKPLDGDARLIQTPEGIVTMYEKGSGKTTLLLHSFNATGTAYETRPIFDRLATSRRVIAIDWLGFGTSDRPKIRYSPELYRKQLRAVMQAIGGDAIDVVALSLPSQYVVLEAVETPEKFGRIALIAPTGFGRYREDRGGAPKPIRWLFLTPIINQLLYNLLTTRAGIMFYLNKVFVDRAKIDRDYVQYCLDTARQAGARNAPIYFVTSQLNDWTARSGYSRVRTPTLIVVGDKGTFTDVTVARSLVAENPNLRLEVLANCGSLPQWEQPDRVAAIISAFLDGQTGPVSSVFMTSGRDAAASDPARAGM